MADHQTDRYEITSLIARGGMAEVYLARDHLLDRPVAVKVLSSEFARDPSFVERFRREARAAANLNHPGIVAVYDWGEAAGTYFIVMEYVEGRSLNDVIKSEAPLQPRRAAEITSDIADALAYAHDRGVVHRDVKPGNVLITRDGQVKVADFGIARAGADVAENLTQTGAVMGTAVYFSPEQAQGRGTDARSDVYSLGVVLYQMVTGYPPFGGDSPVAIAMKHVNEPVPRPSAINPDIGPDLENIILTSLAKNPNDRYQSARDFRNDLNRFRAGQRVDRTPVQQIGGVVGAEQIARGQYLPAPADQTMVVQRQPQMVPAGYEQTMVGHRPVSLPPASPWQVWGKRIGTFLLFSILIAGIVALIAYVAKGGGDDNGNPAAKIDIPDVKGKPIEEGKQTLADQGFKVESVSKRNVNVDPGLIYAMDPDAGERVSKGATIKLTYSEGAEDVKVPTKLIGAPRPEAEQKLTDAGLKAKVVFEPNKNFDPDTVIRIDVQEGSTLPRNATVTLTVAQPPDKVTIIETVGKTLTQAKAELQAEAIQIVGDPIPEYSNTVEKDRVTRTDPAAGQVLGFRDAKVKIYVSQGPTPVELPDVRGKSEADAVSTLRQAKFKPVVVEANFGGTCAANTDKTIVDQEPTPPVQAQPGTEIKITICRFVDVSVTSVPTTTTPPPTTPTSVIQPTSTSAAPTTTPTTPTTVAPTTTTTSGPGT